MTPIPEQLNPEWVKELGKPSFRLGMVNNARAKGALSNPTRRFVLGVLVQHFNCERQAIWASNGRIAQITGMSMSAVSLCLRDLQRDGIIRRQHRMGKTDLTFIAWDVLHSLQLSKEESKEYVGTLTATKAGRRPSRIPATSIRPEDPPSPSEDMDEWDTPDTGDVSTQPQAETTSPVEDEITTLLRDTFAGHPTLQETNAEVILRKCVRNCLGMVKDTDAALEAFKIGCRSAHQKSDREAILKSNKLGGIIEKIFFPAWLEALRGVRSLLLPVVGEVMSSSVVEMAITFPPRDLIELEYLETWLSQEMGPALLSVSRELKGDDEIALQFIVEESFRQQWCQDNPQYLPAVSPKDMKCDWLSAAEECITEKGLAASSGSLVPPGRLLMVVRSGILQHTIPVAINTVPLAVNQDIKVFALDPTECLPEFLFRWVQGFNDALLLVWAKQGATVESIEHSFLANSVVPLPSIEEQRRIIQFLDWETGKIDALIEEQRRLIELLKEKRQAVISHAVTPSASTGDWQTIRLKWLTSKIGSGKTPSGGAEVYSESGIAFLRSQNVYNDGLRLDDLVFIDDTIDEEMSTTRVYPHDVLLNITGASLGRTCIVPEGFQRANVNQHVCIIRMIRKELSPFVALVLKSDSVQEQIASTQNGAAREGLNFDQIGSLLVSMPVAIETQRMILAEVHQKLAKLEELCRHSEQVTKYLQERRSALISAAMTGRIDVRNYVSQEIPADAEEMYEPA